MADPMYAQPPTPKTRPATVRVSSYLLYVTAAVSVITVAIELSQISTTSRVYKTLYAGTSQQGLEAIAGISVGISAFFYILYAVGAVILARFNNKGRQGSRVTTWVIAGISACYLGTTTTLSGIFSGVMRSVGNTSTNGGPSPAELQRALDDALPSWYTPATWTLIVVFVLAAIGAIILLALPASNAYFRKDARGFDPSMPYPMYGAQPPYPGAQPPYPGAQPPYPGQPTGPSGQPPYPPYPGQPDRPPQSPHTGSIPPTDPWDRPRDDGPDRPPTDPQVRT